MDEDRATYGYPVAGPRRAEPLGDLHVETAESWGSLVGVLVIAREEGYVCTFALDHDMDRVQLHMTRDTWLAARVLVGQRVLAGGVLTRTEDEGRCVRIVVDEMEAMPDDADLPTVDDIYRSAPDFHPNQCRYCARRLDDPGARYCPSPAKCRAANSRKRTAVAEVLAEHRTDADRPSLLDREPIVNDPDQLDLF